MNSDRWSDFAWMVLVLPLALLTAFLCLSEPVSTHWIPGNAVERLWMAYSMSTGLCLAAWIGSSDE